MQDHPTAFQCEVQQRQMTDAGQYTLHLIISHKVLLIEILFGPGGILYMPPNPMLLSNFIATNFAVRQQMLHNTVKRDANNVSACK